MYTHGRSCRTLGLVLVRTCWMTSTEHTYCLYHTQQDTLVEFIMCVLHTGIMMCRIQEVHGAHTKYHEVFAVWPGRALQGGATNKLSSQLLCRYFVCTKKLFSRYVRGDLCTVTISTSAPLSPISGGISSLVLRFCDISQHSSKGSLPLSVRVGGMHIIPHFNRRINLLDVQSFVLLTPVLQSMTAIIRY